MPDPQQGDRLERLRRRMAEQRAADLRCAYPPALSQAEALRMTPSVFEARWAPEWYGLDQEVVVGEVADLWFFVDPPAGTTTPGRPILWSGLPGSTRYWELRCEVLRIRHERLGGVLALENRGLDYCLMLESGVRIEVDAEEEPGRAYNLPDGYAFVAEVTDWTLAVTLRRVDEGLRASRGLEGPQEAGADQRAGQEDCLRLLKLACSLLWYRPRRQLRAGG